VPSTREQLAIFKEFLHGKLLNREHPLFDYAMKWIRNFPGGMTEKDRNELRSIVCKTFDLTPESLLQSLNGDIEVDRGGSYDPRQAESDLRHLVPTGGFLDRYLGYTEHSEAPLAYHLFCALVGIGVTVNRRVWFNMGYYKLFPNLGVILLGPSGIKKTSAANIIIDMLAFLELSKIYSEKLTPEQLVEAMKEHAQGIIYAPEMAVFLGRQRYMEGIVPLITRFMDCPDVWSSETIGRGKTTLHNIAISSLMCSTADWFINNTDESVVGGGFIARNILVVQEDSPRTEPIPRPGDPKARERLIYEIGQIHEITGEIAFDASGHQAYNDWYGMHKRATKNAEHEIMATYYQRKPDHAKRVAICMHLAEHGTLSLCLSCFTRAVEILDWIEKFIPNLLRQMFKTASGHNADVVLTAIRNAGGVVDHSDLLRRVQHRLNGAELKPILTSLKDSGVIDEHIDKLEHVYYIRRRSE
jgi:Protein of unknown function (DUF3987)